jgi:FkbH-like protein
MIGELIPPLDPKLIIQSKRALKKQLLSQEGLTQKRIAILCGSTVGEVKNILELFLLQFGIGPVFFEGHYGLFYEDLMFDNPGLASFGPDVIYIHTSVKNVEGYPSPSLSAQERDQFADAAFDRLRGMWDAALNRYKCVLIQNNFEMLPYRVMGNMDAVHTNGRHRFIADLNARMADYQQSHRRFYINDINYLSARIGLDAWFDMGNYYMSKYAMSLLAIPELCHNLAVIIKAIYGKNKKALMLDLDNTLWGGVIGDDGVDNIRLGIESPEGMAFAEFQQYLRALSEIGIVLNVCSKNEEKNALEGFTHPSSVLSREDFAFFAANWEPKPRNIEAAARDLNIGIDSIVFVDDNPAEREIVRQFLPQVEAVELISPETYLATLDRQGYFETVSLSDDDLNRNKAYRENAQRQMDEARFENYGDYLKSLKMVCIVEPFSPKNFARATQLINKTNQFNMTTQRVTEAEVLAMAEDPARIAMCAQLIDRFGDNGIVCILSAGIAGTRATIDLFLMSCRVFKRELEQTLLGELIRRLKLRGVKTLEGVYLPTKRNELVRDFYPSQGFVAVGEGKHELDLDKYEQNREAVMEIENHDA